MGFCFCGWIFARSLFAAIVPSVGRWLALLCGGGFWSAHAAWQRTSHSRNTLDTNGEAAERQISGGNFRQCRIRLLHTNFTAAAVRRLYQRQWTWKGVLHRSNLIFYVLWLPLHILHDAARALPILVGWCTTLDAIYCYLRRTCKCKSFSTQCLYKRAQTDLLTQLNKFNDFAITIIFHAKP